MVDNANKLMPYDPRVTGIDNINRILEAAGIPEELLDDVTIESVKDSSNPEFNVYQDKVGNTALKVSYSGELAKLTKKTSNVHFYDRVKPIPDKWQNKIMYVRDSEMENISIDQYIKNVWTNDGFPFLGENLSFDVQGTAGGLRYGRNLVEVRPSARSYGLTGVAYQKVQYFVDLGHKQAKIVAVVNPFVNTVQMNKKDCYIEMVVPPAVTVQETERRILDRYLREAYGMIRSKAILKEIDDEVIDIVRNPNFKQELRAPANEEQSIEKKASANYAYSYLYTLSKDQVEDEVSSVVGNIRLMVARGYLSKLLLDSNLFPVEEEQAYRFKEDKVRSFVFSKSNKNFVEFEITLGKETSVTNAEQKAEKIIRKFLGDYSVFVDIGLETSEANRLILSVTPNDKISDYVSGDVKAIVNYTLQINGDEDNCGCEHKPEKETVVVKRNLGGFSGVAHYEKPATPATPATPVAPVAPVAPAVTEETETVHERPAPARPRVTEVSTANLIDAYRHGRNG